MTTLTTTMHGARLVANTGTIFHESLMLVTATEPDGTTLGSWMLPARHWLEAVAPQIETTRGALWHVRAKST